MNQAKAKQAASRRSRQKRQKDEPVIPLTEVTDDEEKMVEYAKAILREIREDDKLTIELIAKKHDAFYQSFPEVVNYMISSQQFSNKALILAIRYRKTVPKAKEAFWSVQAYYARELYKALTKRWSGTEAKKIYEKTYDNYKHTFEKIMKEQEEIQQKQIEEEKEAALARRKELTEFLHKLKNPADDIHHGKEDGDNRDNSVSDTSVGGDLPVPQKQEERAELHHID